MPIDPSIILGLSSSSGQQSPPPSPFALIGDLMTMKERGNQIRAQDWALQQKKQDQDDEDAINRTVQRRAAQAPDEASIDWNGVLYDLHSQGLTTAATKFQTNLVNFRKEQANELKVAAETSKIRIETASQMAQSILDSPSPQLAFKRTMPEITKLVGPDIAKMLGTDFDKDVVTQMVTMGQSASDHLAQVKLAFERGDKALEVSRNAVLDQRSWAEKSSEVHTKWTQSIGLMASIARSPEDWNNAIDMGRKGMQGIVPDDLAANVLSQFPKEFSPVAKEQARLLGMSEAQRSTEKVELARIADARAARAAQDDAKLSPDAVEMLSQQFARSGALPPMGLGTNASANRIQVFNRAAQVFKGLDLASQSAAFQSYKLSLNRLQPMLSNANAWSETGAKNLRVFLQSAQKVVDSGSPWINKPLRDVAKDGLGSSEQATFDAARQVVVPEFARLLSSANLQGVLSDKARADVDELMKSSYTYKQLYDVGKVLIGDSENRRTSYQDEINALKNMMNAAPTFALPGQTVGQGGTAPAPAPTQPNVKVAAPPSNPVKGQVWRSPTGMAWFDGDRWSLDFSQASAGTKAAAGVK